MKDERRAYAIAITALARMFSPSSLSRRWSRYVPVGIGSFPMTARSRDSQKAWLSSPADRTQDAARVSAPARSQLGSSAGKSGGNAPAVTAVRTVGRLRNAAACLSRSASLSSLRRSSPHGRDLGSTRSTGESNSIFRRRRRDAGVGSARQRRWAAVRKWLGSPGWISTQITCGRQRPVRFAR